MEKLEKRQLLKEEVAIVKSVLNLFSSNNLTYKQSIELLPEIERALKEVSLNEKVKKVVQNP